MPYNEVEAKIIYNTPRPRETVAEAVKNASFRTQTLTGQDQRVKTEIISLSIQNLSLSCEV
ncbi:MAG: hypothetical protein LBC61_00500 [Candidatus Peribacteria bacterium]|jgi:hypothetical protein|nr:hypothetical protein [Candidatus Peribacteria bacterium]